MMRYNDETVEGGGEPESRLIFEMEGKPRREKLKKYRSYIAVYDDHIEIELGGEEDYIELDDVFDIYIKEPIVEDVTSRETVMEFYEEGELNWYELEDSTFGGLSERIENLLKTEWTHFIEKRQYPYTIKWFVACAAVAYISSGQNPAIFGSAYKEPETSAAQREVLFDSWGINKKADFSAWPEKLYYGRAMSEYLEKLEYLDDLDDDEQELMEKIQTNCGESGIWAWDLQRLIFLCSLGYLCDYISYEDALDWCLKAGQKLQTLYQSWDAFMESYLLGYCFWSGDDLEDEDSEAYMRKGIYDFYKGRADSPWVINWHANLHKEW